MSASTDFAKNRASVGKGHTNSMLNSNNSILNSSKNQTHSLTLNFCATCLCSRHTVPPSGSYRSPPIRNDPPIRIWRRSIRPEFVRVPTAPGERRHSSGMWGQWTESDAHWKGRWRSQRPPASEQRRRNRKWNWRRPPRPSKTRCWTSTKWKNRTWRFADWRRCRWVSAEFHSSWRLPVFALNRNPRYVMSPECYVPAPQSCTGVAREQRPPSSRIGRSKATGYMGCRMKTCNNKLTIYRSRHTSTMSLH